MSHIIQILSKEILYKHIKWKLKNYKIYFSWVNFKNICNKSYRLFKESKNLSKKLVPIEKIKKHNLLTYQMMLPKVLQKIYN